MSSPGFQGQSIPSGTAETGRSSRRMQTITILLNCSSSSTCGTFPANNCNKCYSTITCSGMLCTPAMSVVLSCALCCRLCRNCLAHEKPWPERLLADPLTSEMPAFEAKDVDLLMVLPDVLGISLTAVLEKLAGALAWFKGPPTSSVPRPRPTPNTSSSGGSGSTSALGWRPAATNVSSMENLRHARLARARIGSRGFPLRRQHLPFLGRCGSVASPR